MLLDLPMNKKILFVDDDINVLNSYKRTYRKKYDIVIALSGDEGIKILHKSSQDFAIVISDMKMPEMNGLKFLSEVKAKFPDKIRLVLSGNADLPDVKKAEAKGEIFRYLTKPCERKLFIETMKNAYDLYDKSN